MYKHIPIEMTGNLDDRFDPEKLPPMVRQFYVETFGHATFSDGLEALKLTHAMSGLEGVGCVIDGEPGLGKSRCLDTYISDVYQLPRYQPTAELIKLPILKIRVPGRPTINRVIEKLLLSARHIAPSSKASDSAMTKLHRLIEYQQVEMIIFDEFQHFLHKYAQCTTNDTVTFIKVLMDDFKLAVVFAGKPEGTEVLTKFSELKQRMSFAHVTFTPFTMDNSESVKEFVSYVKAIESCLVRIGATFCSLSNRDMLPRLLLASKGRPRYLARFIMRILLQYQDSQLITKAIMSSVYSNIPFNTFKPFDPFLASPEAVLNRFADYRASKLPDDQKPRHKSGTRLAST